MTELVQRLRDYAHNLGGNPEDYLTWQAANVIELLTERIEENTALMDAARIHIEVLEAAIKAIAHAAGGTVEGHPTSSINVLQRIRELRRIEEES